MNSIDVNQSKKHEIFFPKVIQYAGRKRTFGGPDFARGPIPGMNHNQFVTRQIRLIYSNITDH